MDSEMPKIRQADQLKRMLEYHLKQVNGFIAKEQSKKLAREENETNF